MSLPGLWLCVRALQLNWKISLWLCHWLCLRLQHLRISAGLNEVWLPAPAHELEYTWETQEEWRRLGGKKQTIAWACKGRNAHVERARLGALLESLKMEERDGTFCQERWCCTLFYCMYLMQIEVEAKGRWKRSVTATCHKNLNTLQKQSRIHFCVLRPLLGICFRRGQVSHLWNAWRAACSMTNDPVTTITAWQKH